MARKSDVYHRLRQHFGCNPARLPFVVQDLSPYELPNLHLALEELLGPLDAELVGVIEFDYDISLSKLTSKQAIKQFEEGPVEYYDVALANGQTMACVKQGLFLFERQKERIALLLTDVKHSYPPKIKVEVMASERGAAEGFLRELVAVTRQGRAYRGHVLSIERDCHGGIVVKFHSLPRIERDDIILPAAVLRRVEQHTVDFSRSVARLRDAKRHIKRGILLHGPPGTGKTLSAMYLAAQMPERTVILMTGGGMGSIETACNLARALQPSTVVLEDVDLIGTRREYQMVDANALLFELLNQMDGLADDADILFILTTNRPDILEPALSARPGRIDQAIEIPLPDLECRQRLFDLYSDGLKLELSDSRHVMERTEGASAALLRELLRKAAVLASTESTDGEIVVRDQHLDDALAELLVAGGDLTKSLLGSAAVATDKRSKKPRF